MATWFCVKCATDFDPNIEVCQCRPINNVLEKFFDYTFPGSWQLPKNWGVIDRNFRIMSIGYGSIQELNFALCSPIKTS